MPLSYHPLPSSSKAALPPPPGFAPNAPNAPPPNAAAVVASQTKLKIQKAWDQAIGPAKSLPMQFIMLYMSGGGVQIFSIGIVFMLLVNPLKAVSSINQAFAPLAPAHTDPNSFMTLIGPKLVYIACNILTLSLGLWKCRQMGLLPTGTGDWLAFETRSPAPEVLLA